MLFGKGLHPSQSHPHPALEEALDHLRDLVAVTQPQISAQTQRLHTGSHTGQQTPPVSITARGLRLVLPQGLSPLY